MADIGIDVKTPTQTLPVPVEAESTQRIGWFLSRMQSLIATTALSKSGWCRQLGVHQEEGFGRTGKWRNFGLIRLGEVKSTVVWSQSRSEPAEAGGWRKVAVGHTCHAPRPIDRSPRIADDGQTYGGNLSQKC